MMIVQKLLAPHIVDETTQRRVDRDIMSALQAVVTVDDKFIVNDSQWYALNDKGKVTPCVVNSASFLSSKFLRHLGHLGWTEPKLIDNQEIDAYIELDIPPAEYSVNAMKFPEFFYEYIKTSEGAIEFANGDDQSALYARKFFSLCQRTSPRQPEEFPGKLGEFFQKSTPITKIRIGLEFETGNIASSFRAINKLAGLYAQNLIDAGVFVTSIDKRNCAARIWPTSNRNGSFEELESRNYRSAILYPMWEYGFAPDEFSHDVSYLGQSGELYKIERLREDIVEVDGKQYEVWTGSREKKLLKP